MPRKAQFENEKVQTLSKVVPMLARGNRLIVVKRIPTNQIEKVVEDTLCDYPATSREIFDAVQITADGWTLESYNPAFVSAVWGCRVGLNLVGYSVKFFVKEGE